MQIVWQDLRYSARMLKNKPGFTAIAVLSLALGIGANTAIFSLVDAVLLRPLPFHEPDRLAIVWEDASKIGFPRNTPAPGNYADWKARNQVFEDMAALEGRSYNLTDEGEPEKVEAQGVKQIIPDGMALSAGIRIDAKVFGFTLLLSLSCGLLYPCAAGDEDRPDGGAQSRIDLRSQISDVSCQLRAE